MNRLKEMRPLIYMTCLVTVIAVFFIYSSDSPKTNTKALSVGQVSKFASNANAEEQREQFMAVQEDQYTASRGEYDRLAEPKPTLAEVKSAAPAATPAEPVAKPAAQAAPVAKPTAPAAPAKPKAASAPAKAPTAPVKAAVKTQSKYESEVDVLARLIMAEAQAEPYEAKVAVGAVVINRVQSGQWAGNVKDVIYQKSGGYFQFTPVENGWINKPADAECIRAAKAALSGADPTNGAQFYYDDKVTNEWILAKPVSTRIGHMTYAY